MRVVLDTNTLVSGVISPGGPPRRLLDELRAHVFELCSIATLLAELLDVLSREKFAARLTQASNPYEASDAREAPSWSRSMAKLGTPRARPAADSVLALL